MQFFLAPTKELAQNGFGGTRILTRLGACTRLRLVWASGWFPSWRKTPDRGLGAPAAQRGQRRSCRRRPPAAVRPVGRLRPPRPAPPARPPPSVSPPETQCLARAARRSWTGLVPRAAAAPRSPPSPARAWAPGHGAPGWAGGRPEQEPSGTLVRAGGAPRRPRCGECAAHWGRRRAREHLRSRGEREEAPRGETE